MHRPQPSGNKPLEKREEGRKGQRDNRRLASVRSSGDFAAAVATEGKQNKSRREGAEQEHSAEITRSNQNLHERKANIMNNGQHKP